MKHSLYYSVLGGAILSGLLLAAFPNECLAEKIPMRERAKRFLKEELALTPAQTQEFRRINQQFKPFLTCSKEEDAKSRLDCVSRVREDKTEALKSVLSSKQFSELQEFINQSKPKFLERLSKRFNLSNEQKDQLKLAFMSAKTACGKEESSDFCSPCRQEARQGLRKAVMETLTSEQRQELQRMQPGFLKSGAVENS